jgi:hypothetical protein
MGTTGGSSELVRENIHQFNFQLAQNRFQLVERKMVFSTLDAVQRGIGNPHFSGERGVRKPPPRRPQKLGKLAIQMSLHRPRLAELSSRMRDDFQFTNHTHGATPLPMKIALTPTTAALSKTQTLPQAASILLMLLILAITGCGKDIQQGQIFIATQGGQNVKLGAVEILAFDETAISAFVKQRQAEIAQKKDKLKQDVGTAQTELQKIEEPYNKVVQESHDAQGRYYDQDAVVRRETRKAEELGKRYSEIAARVNQLSNYIAQADQRAVSVRTNAEAQHKNDDEPTRKLFQKKADQDVRMILADKQNQQANLDELLPKFNELNRVTTGQAASLQAEKQKLQSIEAELQEKQKAEKDAENLQVDASRRLDDAKQALASFDVTGILFKDLPPSAERAVSDADGRFRLELPSSGRFAVYAHAQRTVVQTENYFWLVWATEKSDLLLNNANMYGSESVDQVVRADSQ